MIESHGALTPPPDDAVLWRYMDFTKLVAMLEDNALFFGQAKGMGDKYEGVFPKPQADGIRMSLKAIGPGGEEVTQVVLDKKTAVTMASLSGRRRSAQVYPR
jgi:hypothetical protein